MVQVTSFKLWISQIIILLGLLAFFIWLGIRPKTPSHTITQFSVDNGTMTYAIELENPNKDSGIYYDNINLTFSNSQDTLGSVIIPRFYQDKGETTPEIGIVEIKASLKKKVADQISNGTAQFQVALTTRIKYRTWGIRSPRHKMQSKAQLPVGKNGKIPGKAKLHINWKRRSR